MCLGRSSSPPPAPIPAPDPAIARREAEQSSERMANQQKDVVKRRNQAYGMGGRRSLISSTGGGFLAAGENPTLGA